VSQPSSKWARRVVPSALFDPRAVEMAACFCQAWAYLEEAVALYDRILLAIQEHAAYSLEGLPDSVSVQEGPIARVPNTLHAEAEHARGRRSVRRSC
jgi:hypothetical protein